MSRQLSRSNENKDKVVVAINNKGDVDLEIGFESRDAMNEQEHIRKEQLVLLGRRASKIHFQMNLFPSLLVRERIKPTLQLPHTQWQQRAWFVLLLMVVVALSLAYAKTLMPYPCDPRMVTLGDVMSRGSHGSSEGTDVQKIQWHDVKELPARIRETNCHVEDRLRNVKLCLCFRLALVGIVLSLTVVMSVCNTIFMKFGCYLMNHYLWRPLLMFWYLWIDPQAPSLKYANAGMVFPPLYTPVSVVICFLYVMTVSEFTYIGFVSNNLGTGLVLAHTLAQLTLKIADRVMGGTEEVSMVIDGYLSHWTADANHVYEHYGHIDSFDITHRKSAEIKDILESGGRTRTVLDKLRKAGLYRKTYCTLTKTDLDDLVQLAPLGDGDAAMNSRLGDDDNSLTAVGILTHIFLHDTNEVVNLRSGEVSLSNVAGVSS